MLRPTGPKEPLASDVCVGVAPCENASGILPGMSSIDSQGEDPSGSDAPASAPTSVVRYERGGVWVVVASGPYDANTLGPLADALEAAVPEHRRVVLDASGITFADSTVLNLLLGIHRATTLRVAAPPPQLLRILQITGADSVLDVRETVEDAVSG
jgi:anti-anti-sigma factor